MKYSIQHKILILFSMVIFIGLASLLFVSYQINEQNTEHVVHNNMISAGKSLDLYLKQYFLINNMEMSKTTLESEGDKIAKSLGAQMGSNVQLYDGEGNKLSSYMEILNTSNEDYLRALNGETAYTINHIENRVVVNLSYPIEFNETCIGILRYSSDYSELYQYNTRFKNVISSFAALIFVLVLITSFIISRQIAKPVRSLIKSSEQLSQGNFDLKINIRSRDEIGELADRFKMMVQRIKEQIGIIEKDRDALKEAQAQNKRFFDNVTHELKTPLTSILGYAQVLKDNGFSDKEFFDKGTTYIINESKRLNHLVIDILELSKASSKDFSYHFETLNLTELIKDTCEEMRMKGKKYNMGINCNSEDNIMIRGDRGKLKEVLINLIDNGLKYGKVNTDMEVDAYLEHGSIILKVKDRGEGIAKEHMDNIFKPFYRVSKSSSGEKGSTGLGLAIVKGIVENHGGGIEIKSTPSEGTEVVIRFGGIENA